MSLRHAILTQLEQGPASGYDLSQAFRTGIGNFWNASHQQIYLELRKLHDEGLVDLEVQEQQERPDRKVYHLTDAGLSTLRDWMQQPSKPPRVNDALLVKVYGGHLLPPDVLLAEFASHEQLHRERLAEYRRYEAHYHTLQGEEKTRYRLPYLTLRRGILYEEDWLRWLAEAREVLGED